MQVDVTLCDNMWLKSFFKTFREADKISEYKEPTLPKNVSVDFETANEQEKFEWKEEKLKSEKIFKESCHKPECANPYLFQCCFYYWVF